MAREVVLCFGALLLLQLVIAKNGDKVPDSEKWKKKDVRDYSDADLERLYDQWEEEDEELEPDELPEWKRPQEPIDLSRIDPNDPESMIQMSKKGRTLMMFATVSGDPTEEETQTITQIWQQSLFNANFEVQRYVVGQNRVLFMLKDGSKAFEIKKYLIQQERCEVVTIEGKDFYGKGSDKYEEPKPSKSKKQKQKTGKKSENKKSDNKKKLSSDQEKNKKRENTEL